MELSKTFKAGLIVLICALSVLLTLALDVYLPDGDY